MWMEAVLARFDLLWWHSPGASEKITKALSNNNWEPGWDLNLGPLKLEDGMLPILSTHIHCRFNWWVTLPAEEDADGEVHYFCPHRSHNHPSEGDVRLPPGQEADQPVPGSIIQNRPRGPFHWKLIHRTARIWKEKGLRTVTWNSYCEVGGGGAVTNV